MTRKPKLLDLFCGAGGCSEGYARAGFDVYGVDILPQPRYPFDFVQADALTYPLDGFDVIHASPPCQAYSLGYLRWKREAPRLIEVVRERLQTTGLTYIIENVPLSPLVNPIILCGQMFSLGVIRHRLFESNARLTAPVHYPHNGGPKDHIIHTVAGHGGDGCGHYSCWKRAMQIDWMTKDELREAIPPAYTEYIGWQLR